ncbi:hypothetical protein Tco_1150714, partial [Tanacetum coccineum]
MKAQIIKLKKQAKPVIKHHKAWLKSVSLKQRFPRKSFAKKHRVHKESVSKQGRKFAKGESSVQRDPLFDVIPEDTVDHMETENAQDEGRTREMVDEDKEIDEKILSTEDVLHPLFDEMPEDTVEHMETENAQNEGRSREMVDEDKEIDENILSTKDVLSTDKEEVSTDMEKVSTDRPIVSTDGSKVSTNMQIEGTDEQVEGTEEEIATQATQTSTQTPTSMIFGDDETIAKVLPNISQAKVVSRKKEKGVELKDVEETDRPRPTSTRSLLTLNPLPKINPKDKRKKKIEEEDESESESDGIPEAEKKFKQLESDEEMARKIQEAWEAEEERNRIAEEKAANEALIRNFDDHSKFLHDTIAAQRRFLAQQRSEAIRNTMPTLNHEQACERWTIMFEWLVSPYTQNPSDPISLILQKSIEYGVSKELDTAYWGFLRVGTTFDIFLNIILIPYLEYGVLSPLDTVYWSLNFYGLLVSADTDRLYLLDGYGILVFRIVKMDNPNITMEEYIRLEEEKTHRRGNVYNWETATYGKIWDNEDVHDLRSVESEFPTIVFNDTLTSEATLSYEPTISSLNDEI